MPATTARAAVTAVIVVAIVGVSTHRSVSSEVPLTPPSAPVTASSLTSTTTTTTGATPPPDDRTEAARLYGLCIEDTRADPAAVAVGHGTGPVVAVVGDSLTTQIRERLTGGQTHRWVVWSRCGASVQTALDAGAAESVRAQHPDVVVIALGTNDAGFPRPHAGSSARFAARARRLLDQFAGVSCVVWVDAGQNGDSTLQQEMDAVNGMVRAGGTRVVDWDRIVNREPGLLLDRVHLTSAGEERRAQALAAAVDQC